MIRTRANVFKVLSGANMVVPLAAEVGGYLHTQTLAGSLWPALGMFFVNAAALVWYWRTKRFNRAFLWSSWISFALFVWGTTYAGGVTADHYDYAYFFILSNGFYFGARALMGAATCSMMAAVGLFLLERAGYVPPVQHSTTAIATNLVLTQFFVCWFILQYHFARQEAEDLLRNALAEASRARDHLRATQDNSPALQFSKDLTGKYLHVNPAFERVTGRAAADVIGRSAADLFPPHIAKVIEILDRDTLDRGEGRTFNELSDYGSGLRWHTITLFPIRDERSRITSLGGIIVDTHDALTAAEEYRALNDALDDTALVLQLDPRGRIKSANENFCRASGYAADELRGRDHLPNGSVTDEGGLFAAVARTIANGAKWTGEVREKSRAGVDFNLVLVVIPVPGPAGEAETYLAIGFDVTARVQAESRYRTLVDTMHEGVVLWNAAGQCVHHNDAALKILNLTSDALLNRAPREASRRTSNEDGTELRAEDYPASVALRSDRAVVNQVMGFVDHTETQRWLTVNARPVTFGNERVAVCTFMDITAHKETVRELKVRGDELNSLFQAMTEGMYLIDLEGRIKIVNRAATQILGYAENELIGAGAHALIHHSYEDGSHFPAHDCHLYRSLRDGKISSHPIDFFWTKAGVKVTVASISVPVEDNGVVIGALVTFRDLSEIRRLEELVKAEQAKSIHNAKLASLGEMSAGVAHEINNPLAIVTGSLEMLNRYRDQPDKFAAKMVSLHKATGRIAKIVKGLQKFARSSTGSHQRPESLALMIADSVVMTEAKARRHDVTVRLEIEPHHVIVCDSVEIEQVLINLINNAIDAVKTHAERWVELRTFTEKGRLILRVMDSGPGLTAEIEEKLFQPFFTTKPVGQGTGLGLSITKGILEQHGATITVNRRVANTCFDIKFKAPGASARVD